MRNIRLGQSDLAVSQIGLGCMRMAGLSVADASRVIETAREQGINFFDHADIYGGGDSERVFSKAIGMNTSVREQIILQSKVGIRQGYYDFSYEHIMKSVDGILHRLNTDYLDVLLLHRPDALMEPEEVSRAFDELHSAGKVRWFGVSNFNQNQMKLAFSHSEFKIQANQLQLSLAHPDLITEGTNVNVTNEDGSSKSSAVLEYCRLEEITVQAWSPMQYGQIEGNFLENPAYQELAEKLGEIAQREDLSVGAVAIAWLLRHPARVQPIIGTMTPERIRAICKASDFMMSRSDWYGLLKAAGHPVP